MNKFNFSINLTFFDEAYEDTKDYLKKAGEWENCELNKMLNILEIMFYVKHINDCIDTNLSDDLAKIVLKKKEKKESEKTKEPIFKVTDFDMAYEYIKRDLQETNEWENADSSKVLRFTFIVMDMIPLARTLNDFREMYLENKAKRDLMEEL